jgi:NADPH:quinone reductase-like Zn-dependent oxidoreductase
MVVFGAASGDRGSLVPAEMMINNHQSSPGSNLPNIMTRPSALRSEPRRRYSGWISSGELKLTRRRSATRSNRPAKPHDALEGRETTGKIVLNP